MNLAFRLAAGNGDDPRPPLPGSLQVNRRLGQWLRFHREGYVEAFPGKVELGQGIATALAQIVADELDVPLAKVRMVPRIDGDQSRRGDDLGQPVDPGVGHRAAPRVRRSARDLPRRGSPPARCAGRADHADRWRDARPCRIAHGLLDARRRRIARPRRDRCGPAQARPRRLVVGTSVPRLDLPAKVFGTPRFIHDLVLPDMMHARVLRPSTAGRDARGRRRSRVSCRRPTTCVVVRDGSFVAVLAATERGAELALERLAGAARWREASPLPDASDLARWLEGAARRDRRGRDQGVAATRRGRAYRACALHQAVHRARLDRRCRARSRDGATAGSTCGRTARASTTCAAISRSRCASTTARSSCITSKAPAATATTAPTTSRSMRRVSRSMRRAGPVRVQWSRADELGWAPFGPAMLVEIEADLDADDAIVGWRHTIVEQRPQQPPRTREVAGTARRVASRAAVRAPARDQRADRRGRRRRAQQRAVLRLPGVGDRQASRARHAAAHLGAALARCVRQRVRDRIVPGRARAAARRGSRRVPARASCRTRARAR